MKNPIGYKPGETSFEAIQCKRVQDVSRKPVPRSQSPSRKVFCHSDRSGILSAAQWGINAKRFAWNGLAEIVSRKEKGRKVFLNPSVYSKGEARVEGFLHITREFIFALRLAGASQKKNVPNDIVGGYSREPRRARHSERSRGIPENDC